MENPYAKFHKTGNFSWIYDNYSDVLHKKCVDVQWLMFQGSEFRILCDNPEHLISEIGKYLSIKPRVSYNLWSQKSTDIITDTITLTPEDILKIDPNANIVITFFSKYNDKNKKFKHLDENGKIIIE